MIARRRVPALALAGALLLAGVWPERAVAIELPVTPAVLTSVPPPARDVALTFDDGPSPFTPAILALLRRYRAHATFFVVGEHVPQYPGFVRAAARAGDEIGDHTYTHPDLETLPDTGIMFELEQTQLEVQAAAGLTAHWFRPPYGEIDARVADLAARAGLQSITWSVDPRDWSLPGVTSIVSTVMAATRPGSVILMHDGGGNRSETVAALAQILPDLRDHGYHFLTLDELFYPRQLAAAARALRAREQAARRKALQRAWRRAHRRTPTPTALPTPSPTPSPYRLSCTRRQLPDWWPPRVTLRCAWHHAR